MSIYGVFQRNCGRFNLTSLAKLFTQNQFQHGKLVPNRKNRKKDQKCHGILRAKILIIGNNISPIFFTSSVGIFALITDPKAVVTKTINSNEKTKLRRSMFNLENNKNNTTFISRDKMFNRLNSRKLLQKRFHLTLVINIVKGQLKWWNTEKWVIVSHVVSLHNLISLYVKSLWACLYLLQFYLTSNTSMTYQQFLRSGSSVGV